MTESLAANLAVLFHGLACEVEAIPLTEWTRITGTEDVASGPFRLYKEGGLAIRPHEDVSGMKIHPGRNLLTARLQERYRLIAEVSLELNAKEVSTTLRTMFGFLDNAKTHPYTDHEIVQITLLGGVSLLWDGGCPDLGWNERVTGLTGIPAPTEAQWKAVAS